MSLLQVVLCWSPQEYLLWQQHEREITEKSCLLERPRCSRVVLVGGSPPDINHTELGEQK